MAVNYLPLALVLAGCGLLIASLFPTGRIIRFHPDATSRWQILFIMICLFVPAYLGFIFLKGEALLRPGEVWEALVFFGGGLFVLIVTHLSESTVCAFRRMENLHGVAVSTQTRLASILDNCVEGIVTFDGAGRVESFNAASEKLFGFTEAEVIGRDISLFIRPPSSLGEELSSPHSPLPSIEAFCGHEGELLGYRKGGHMFPVAVKVGPMHVDGRKMYTALLSDITERKELMSNLQFLAERDGLTGLYNRAYFQGQLDQIMERIGRQAMPSCALLYIDLDNFKYVNDTLGHAAGDSLLIEVSNLLNRRARRSDLIARLGGDEFIVLLHNATETEAFQAADAFRQQIVDHTFSFKGSIVDIGCSIGLTILTADTGTASEAFSQADLACHLAKRRGRNRVHLFNPEDQADMTTMSLDIGWSARIKKALAGDGFVLACQPIFETRSRRVACYEVLLRLKDDSGNLIMPSGFLPSAERFGLSGEIDKWVIAEAITLLASERKVWPDLRFAINLSGQTLSNLDVLDLIESVLAQTGVEPAALTFEVTETAAIADMGKASRFLERLRQLGCRTALDDFGSGFSSFSYLRDLPVDEVKLDGRFVRNVARNPVDAATVRAMHQIVQAMGKKAVAEFVETAESLDTLREIGVDFVQGNYMGPPVVSADRPEPPLPARRAA